MLKPHFLGQIIAGQFKLDSSEREKFEMWCETLPDGGYELQVGKKETDRSTQQNRWWHGIFLPLVAKEIGELNDEIVCYWFREMFLGKKCQLRGKEINYVPSSADLSVAEMGELIDKSIIFASTELNIIVPEINEK